LNRSHADRRGHRSAQSGFTLFEVVVALAIAALGLSFLMAAASTGLGSAALAAQYIEATRRAQSRLAELGVTEPLHPGVWAGDDGGGYSWRRRISPPQFYDTAPSPEGMAPLGLFAVEVTISWRSGDSIKSVSLRSKRIARL
jgi:general secretion pathway protein I